MPGVSQEVHETSVTGEERRGEERGEERAWGRAEGDGPETVTEVGKHWPVGQIQPLCLFLYIRSYWHSAILVHLHFI